MRAITRDVYGGPEVLSWAEVERPEPARGEVVVEVKAASVNAADLYVLRGTPFPARLAFGITRPRRKGLGADVAGTVGEVGAGVTRLKPGDKVFGDLSEVGFGAFAEQVVVAETALTLVPAGVGLEDAAASPMAAVTALQALRDKGKLRRGEHLLVTGASGGVGSFAVQLAKALGAHVTAVTSTRNVEAVSSLGADEVIDRDVEDFRAREGRYDLIVETAGRGSITAAQRALRVGGRYVFVGGSGGATFAALLRGQGMLAKPNGADLETVGSHLANGTLRPLVTQVFPLARTAEAIAAFEAGHKQGKVVLTAGEA